ncbi:MAG: hypothetical protein QN163_10440 [Armatimonadota bacterium]|nr:hypothetical protein [Armatimonadota bacterium]MDR5696169.1 hypothetical protein [Armatimonadota bacterium]
MLTTVEIWLWAWWRRIARDTSGQAEALVVALLLFLLILLVMHQRVVVQ